MNSFEKGLDYLTNLNVKMAVNCFISSIESDDIVESRFFMFHLENINVIGNHFINSTGVLNQFDVNHLDDDNSIHNYIKALCYYHGYFVESDYDSFLKYCNQAAESDLLIAKIALLIDLELTNHDLAVDKFKDLSDEGIGIATVYLLLFTSPTTELLDKAIKQGNSYASYLLAYCYEYGVYGKKRPTLSTENYINAASNSIREAQYKIGLSSEYASLSNHNLLKTVAMYSKASDGGYILSSKHLGYLMLSRIYQTQPNYQKALLHFKHSKLIQSDLDIISYYTSHFSDDGIPNSITAFLESITLRNKKPKEIFQVAKHYVATNLEYLDSLHIPKLQTSITSSLFSYLCSYPVKGNTDFSSSTTILIKSFEVILKKIFYDGFILYLENNCIDPTDLRQYKLTNFIIYKKNKKYHYFNPEEGIFSLSRFSTLIGERFYANPYNNPLNTLKNDSRKVFPIFLEYCKSILNISDIPGFLYQLQDEIQFINLIIRNVGAHTGYISKIDATFVMNYFIYDSQKLRVLINSVKEDKIPFLFGGETYDTN